MTTPTKSPLVARETNRIADGDVGFAWEHAKENVRPVRGGRDGRRLNEALVKRETRGTTTSGREAEKARLLAAATREDAEDRLGEWCALIKWTEQTYATGNGLERELMPVLERCARELQEEERYKEDARYLRVWIKYADCCAEPGDIFKFLRANSMQWHCHCNDIATEKVIQIHVRRCRLRGLRPLRAHYLIFRNSIETTKARTRFGMPCTTQSALTNTYQLLALF